MRSIKPLCLMSALGGLALTLSACRPFEPGYVTAGGVGIAIGSPLRSEGFVSCSALVLDVGDSAVMAHAFPGNNRSPNGVVNVENAVEYCWNKLKDGDLDPTRSTAYINAGSEEDLQTLLSGLKAGGIRVKDATVSPATLENPRDVSYDPLSDRMDVSQAKGKLGAWGVNR